MHVSYCGPFKPGFGLSGVKMHVSYCGPLKPILLEWVHDDFPTPYTSDTTESDYSSNYRA